jgi:hypothetical protein
MSTRDLAKALKSNIGPQGVVGQDWWGVVTAVNAATTVTNMLSAADASFETSLGTWTHQTNCTIAQSTAQALDGTHSMALTSTAAGLMCAQTTYAPYSVVAGATYTAIASCRAAVAWETFCVGAQWFTAVGGFLGGVSGPSVNNTTSGWTQAVVTAAAPATAALALVLVQVNSTGGASEVHYVDCCALYHGGPYSAWVPGGSNLTATPNTVTCTINGTASVVSCRYLAAYTPTVSDVVVGRRDVHGDYWSHGKLA